MRYKFPESASTAIQPQSSSLSYTLTQFQQWVEKKTHLATLMVLLGLGFSFWVTIEAIAHTQYAYAQETGREVPQIQADTDRVDISLDRQPNETYETLLRRAETAAKNAAQASFDKNALTTDVSVIIVAQNQGTIAPVLSLEVNRSQWRSRPDVSWITYFTSARALLQLEDLATTAPAQPGTNPVTRSRQPTNGIRSRNTNPGIGQPTNPTTGQPVITNPGTLGQPTNPTLGQPSTDPNLPTPSEQTPPPGTGLSPQPATVAPVTPIGNPQTPSPGTGLSPQVPTAVPVAPVSNPMTPTIPNAGSAPSPNSLPTFGPQSPSAVPSNNGTPNNTPTPPTRTSAPGI